LLAKFPEIGRPVEELPAESREWVIGFGSGAYVALYRYDGRLQTYAPTCHCPMVPLARPRLRWKAARRMFTKS